MDSLTMEHIPSIHSSVTLNLETLLSNDIIIIYKFSIKIKIEIYTQSFELNIH